MTAENRKLCIADKLKRLNIDKCILTEMIEFINIDTTVKNFTASYDSKTSSVERDFNKSMLRNTFQLFFTKYSELHHKEVCEFTECLSTMLFASLGKTVN